jgi:hypothetical protein
VALALLIFGTATARAKAATTTSPPRASANRIKANRMRAISRK